LKKPEAQRRDTELAVWIRNIAARARGLEFSSSFPETCDNGYFDAVDVLHVLKRCRDVRVDPFNDYCVVRGKTVDGVVLDIAIVPKFVAQRIKIIRAWSVAYEEKSSAG
jgi:hypothetical protein